MRASGYRIAPLVIVLAIVAVLLALSDGCGSGSDDGTPDRKPASAPSVPSDASGSVVVWAVGDGADGGRDARRVARLIERDRPDRFLYLGDVYDDGTAEEFTQNYDAVYGGLANRTAPTPGNHDWFNHAEGYDPYWKKKLGHRPHPYYSFRTGGWQIISLNSETEHGSQSPQVAWLRSQVRGGGTCRLAFWHRPRYSAGDHHGDQPDVQPFWGVLEGNAAIVLNGHEHDMQRFAPRAGITEFVSGAGGRGLYGLEKPYKGLVFGNDNKFGALRLELSPGAATYRFVTAGGKTLDSGKLACRPA
jgi:calcineurin-like phosphoesterase family protein